MKIDGTLGGIGETIIDSAQEAKRLEALGFDGAFTAEVKHDPFLPVALAATQTQRLMLGTGIAVAFARNPMTVANVGYDLQLLTRGRFVLGLGSQIKPHITKRYSMDWSSPADRMHEYIRAVRAIWTSWQLHEPLRFRGEFYRHTLMTPMFDPGPNPYGPAPIYLAAVGSRMARVAGEVADGLIAHAFTTPSYFRAVTVPALEEGLRAGGRARRDFAVSLPMFIVSGRDEGEIAGRARMIREQIAFYGSTPAYKPVLDHHGWGELSAELNQLSKRGEWSAMGDAIDDSILREFAVVGPPETVAAQVRARYGGVVDRMTFFGVGRDDFETWAPVIDELRRV